MWPTKVETLRHWECLPILAIALFLKDSFPLLVNTVRVACNDKLYDPNLTQRNDPPECSAPRYQPKPKVQIFIALSGQTEDGFMLVTSPFVA